MDGYMIAFNTAAHLSVSLAVTASQFWLLWRL
jgi:hypothetical protein